MCVSRFGLAVRQRDLGLNLLRLSFHFKGCGLWILSCDFVPHNYETLKWLSSLPTLMLKSFWWWQCTKLNLHSLKEKWNKIKQFCVPVTELCAMHYTHKQQLTVQNSASRLRYLTAHSFLLLAGGRSKWPALNFWRSAGWRWPKVISSTSVSMSSLC